MVAGGGVSTSQHCRVRTLFLLRHAKSSWTDPSRSDHDRPLAPRGVRAASLIAEHLRSEKIRPDLVLCSTARRARDTLDAVRPVLGDGAEVQLEDSLYGAGAGQILQRLHEIDAVVRSVMVVGHNPGLEDLAMDLAGDGDQAALSQLRMKFPTGALATLEFRGRGGWPRVDRGQAYLAELVVPRQLGR